MFIEEVGEEMKERACLIYSQKTHICQDHLGFGWLVSAPKPSSGFLLPFVLAAEGVLFRASAALADLLSVEAILSLS